MALSAPDMVLFNILYYIPVD